MSLKPGEFLRAAIIPRGFQELLPNELDPLALRLARKQRMSRGVLFTLATAERHPTPQEALGMLYFIQTVKTCDDALDRKDITFSDATGLRKYLINAEIAGANGVKVDEVLNRCLDCYSPDRQAAINSFMDKMCQVPNSLNKRSKASLLI